MSSSTPSVARLLSLANAARSLRTLPTRAIVPVQSPLSISRSSSNLFSTLSRPSTRSPLTASTLQRQAYQGFSQRSLAGIKASPSHQRFMHPQNSCRRYQTSSHTQPKQRRPFRFFFKVMAVSGALITLPVLVMVGAPVVVPLAVGGAICGFLILSGGIFLIALPVFVIGGAATFWYCSWPAALALWDLNKVAERVKDLNKADKHGHRATAQELIGSDWTVQAATPEEWFRWSFPSKLSTSPLDKVDIRIGVFDPNDHSQRKKKSFQLINNMQEQILKEEDQEEIDQLEQFEQQIKDQVRIKNKKDRYQVKNLSVEREGDHIHVQFETKGQDFIESKLAKKYLALGQLVDQAASDMEAQAGSKLGNELVLVQKDLPGWRRWSPFGDLALRIPFDRTFIHDTTDDA